MFYLIGKMKKAAGAFFILALSTHATLLTPQDSLYVMVAGGASVSTQNATGSKAVEDGLLKASLSHSLLDNLRAVISVRGGRNSSDAFLEEGALFLGHENFGLAGGFLSYRAGFAELYRPHSIFNLLFDKAILWDVNGFGIAGNVVFKNCVGLAAGSSLNSHESGQIYASIDYNGARYRARALTGFQSYSAEEQDNSYSEGVDFAADYGYLRLHALGKFMQYMGFGHATNSTMIPGKSFNGLFEAAIVPNAKIHASAQVYYENYEKRFNHELLSTGMEAVWMVLPRCGLGAGFEYQKDDSYYTDIPRVFLVFIPLPQKTEIRLSFQQGSTSGSQPLYGIFGEFWAEF
jgi:hypothetical protein